MKAMKPMQLLKKTHHAKSYTNTETQSGCVTKRIKPDARTSVLHQKNKYVMVVGR